jgi:hypothetical protein
MVGKRAEDEFALNLLNRMTDKAANDRGQLRQFCRRFGWPVLGGAGGSQFWHGPLPTLRISRIEENDTPPRR